MLVSFLFSLLIGPLFIKKIKKYHQPIRLDGPKRHIEEKSGTPTMGGLLIVMSVTVSTFLLGNLSISSIWIILFSMWSFALIGFIDDFKKISKKKGISARSKMIMQILFGTILSYFISYNIGNDIYIPFFKNLVISIPTFLYLIWGNCVIIGSSNAVNLTDGLDGLAIFPVMMSNLTFAIIAYAVGHLFFSIYLQIPHVPNIGELTIFFCSWVGASLGFLWYNAPPAKIFMGDTGSLAAGASLGTASLLLKHELVWAIVGGLFVVEAMSVMIQVFSYKCRKKRVFLMAPIHHHFEQKGIKESTIVIRFWIISVILALIGIASLKIR